MSKAFVNEDAEAAQAAPLQPARPGRPSPITPGGHRRLQEERARSGDAARVAWLERVLGTVEVVAPRAGADGGAGFGCAVTVADERGRQKTYVLVGPDEVDAPSGRITADSPVGRALLGKRPGDDVELTRGGRVEELTVVAVAVDAASV